jgi:Uma2 family endonuclease
MAKLTIYNEEEEQYQLVEEPDASYTYSYYDYMQWKFKERLELIKGHIYKLSTPNSKHQIIVGKLHVRFYNFLEKKTCKVFVSPFDVRLPRKNRTGDKEITTVVQPDVFIVCDETKIDERGCCGAPDLVVEVLSPGNSSHEVRTKFNLYEEAGVKEYWLINPEEENLFIYLLNDEGKYSGAKVYAAGDTVTSAIAQGFTIDVADIFTY